MSARTTPQGRTGRELLASVVSYANSLPLGLPERAAALLLVDTLYTDLSFHSVVCLPVFTVDNLKYSEAGSCGAMIGNACTRFTPHDSIRDGIYYDLATGECTLIHVTPRRRPPMAVSTTVPIEAQTCEVSLQRRIPALDAVQPFTCVHLNEDTAASIAAVISTIERHSGQTREAVSRRASSAHPVAAAGGTPILAVCWRELSRKIREKFGLTPTMLVKHMEAL